MKPTRCLKRKHKTNKLNRTYKRILINGEYRNDVETPRPKTLLILIILWWRARCLNNFPIFQCLTQSLCALSCTLTVMHSRTLTWWSLPFIELKTRHVHINQPHIISANGRHCIMFEYPLPSPEKPLKIAFMQVKQEPYVSYLNSM